MSTFIPIACPCLGKEEIDAVIRPLNSGWLTQGAETKHFEDEFAALHNTSHAIAVSSCTTGLHLMLAAMGVGLGDEVIIPSFTWVATANVIEQQKAKPVFVDIKPDTFLMDIDDAARKVTSRTKAVIPVHLFGLCVDTQALAAACPSIPILGDAACAVAGKSPNGSAGQLGLASAFSLHPRKIITTGEGGMITTNDSALADTIRSLRNHGASVSEEERHSGSQPWLLPSFLHAGFNYRITDIQSAIGRAQLAKLPKFLEERQLLASRYQEALGHIPWLSLPVTPAGYTHGWQAYVCRVKKSIDFTARDYIMEKLHKKGISTRPGTHAVHLLEFYAKKYRLKPADLPNAFLADKTTIALPFYNGMTIPDQDAVIAALRAI